ncbi:MAG: DMT family transporter [Sneathiella sp.]
MADGPPVFSSNLVMTSQLPANNNNLVGIFYMVIAVFMLSTMDAVGKWLVEAEFSVFQILFVRGSINTVIMMCLMPFLGGLNLLKTNQPYGHLIRSLFGFVAPFLFFSALQFMPLAEATAVFFVSPFVMTALSVPFFKEHVGIHRWSAIIVGFLGVLYVVQPTSNVFNPAVIFVLGASVCYSILMLTSRWLGRKDKTYTIVFYVNLGVMICGALGAPFVWKSMTFTDLGVVGLMAVLSLAGNFSIVKAFTTAEVGVITPFEYTALLNAVFLGYVFFGEVPTANVWIGAAIITASGLYMVYRENKKKPDYI